MNFKRFNSPFIIAEIGVNHDGDVIKAKELIFGAKKSGADAIKLQSFKASELATESTPKVPYQLNSSTTESHKEMLAKLELSHSQQSDLQQYCREIDIKFMSTPYSLAEAKFLEELGVEFFKVASADIVDLPLLNLIASFGRPTIVSTGMATREEVGEVVKIFKLYDAELILMHCTSEYPTINEHAFLARIESLKELHNGVIGFSDHTTGSLAAVMSIGMGCKVIEKHITLRKADPGPDHAASMEISEFHDYCLAIREAEKIMGHGEFIRTLDEEKMALTSRKTLHTGRRILAGEKLLESDVTLMRPGTGIYWRDRHTVLGLYANIDLEPYSLISPQDFVRKLE